MSFKQSITLLFILLSVSFSASAELVKIYRLGNNGEPALSCSGLSIGSVLAVGTQVDLGGRVDGTNTCLSYYVTAGYVNVSFRNYRDKLYTGQLLTEPVDSCPAGQEVNPTTGKCEEPEVPFCDKSSTKQQMNEFQQACLSQGNGFTADVSCSNEAEDLQMSCSPPPPVGCEVGSPSFPDCLDEPKCDQSSPDWNPEYGMCCSAENDFCDVPQDESCTIFSPNWDECRSDSDVNPPSGGDLSDPTLPDGGGSGSPSPDKEQPEVEDALNVRDSIYKMNDDLNGMLTAMNNDMNKNHAESKSALDALKASTDTNTQSVIDGANHVAGAVNAQSDMLSQIGNNTNSLLSSNNNLLNNGFGELTKGLNSLGDGVVGVASGLSGLNDTNEKGFGDVVTGIGGLTDKLGQITDRPLNGSNNPAIPLYSSEKINDLLDEVAALETEYTETLNSFKDYFYSGEVNSGDYVSHSIELNWHGVAISQNNVALDTLRDNAAIIGAIVIFLAGLAGIRAIGGSF